MKELVGATIASILVDDDQSILAFITDLGTIAFEAIGDCCSETWFADITGVSALIGGKVASVGVVSLDDYNVDDGRGRQEEDEVYGFKLVTDKGHADIVFRNSSNGYYGGWLETFEKELPAGMVEITDDWTA